MFRLLVVLSVLATPLAAQELLTLRDARAQLFSENGAVTWEVVDHPALTEADRATLDQINRIQPQPYYAALAMAPDAGLASEVTALAANYHDEENARAAALAACEANRDGAGAPCIVALVIRPEGWEPGRALQMSYEATSALRGAYRELPRRSRALAISPTTGNWGMGQGPAEAEAACGAPDCVAVIEG